MTDPVSLNQHRTDRACNDRLQALITSNLAALHEGKVVLESLSEHDFNASCSPVFRSTLGAHYRHLIEHYSCFLDSLERQDELICYASRPRNGRIESDRDYALSEIDSVLERLADMSSMELKPTCQFMRDQEGIAPVETNLERELLFLQSHTIHHHAIIGAMCRLLQRSVPDNFGVAIATQAFEAALEVCDNQNEQSEAS